MTSIIRLLFFCLASISTLAHAWSGDDLELLSEQFQAGVPADIRLQQQGWTFFTLQDCFASGSTNCWGANPDSPYGIPIFADSLSNATQLRPDEAIVYIVKTPPMLRYFSFIPYLHTRSVGSERKTLFASVDEPLNNLKIVTSGSSIAGENVFDQLTVVVMTQDLRLFYRIKSMFYRIGFPAPAVQLLSLSHELVTLGKSADADSLTLLMRVALPEDKASFNDYISVERPVRVFRLTPMTQQTPWPVAKPIPTTPGSIAEPAELGTALATLVEDIQARYQAKNLVAADVRPWAPVGETCIKLNLVCGGDNYDAVYTSDIQGLVNNPKHDFTIIAGVNHHRLNKAIYLNHSISDPTRKAGVASFNDNMLAGSAAYHAGITDQTDPRNEIYKNLYAYMVAADCRGFRFCLEVPQASTAAEVGIAPDGLYDILGRIYVDPATTVRPRLSDLILSKVLRPAL